MIKVAIEKTWVEPGNVLIGPDRVHVVTAHGDWIVPIPRGGGEAYAASLGSELLLEHAQVTEPATDGPVTVVVDGRPDYPHDFELGLTGLTEAKDFLRALGFRTFRHIHMQQRMRNGAPLVHVKTGEKIFGLLPTEGVAV